MRCWLISLPIAIAVTVSSSAQAPWRGTNLQHFPKDTTRDDLTQRMREFSFALDVRCQYCHAGGDGVSFDGVVFASDEKPAKLKARAMLKMVDEINQSLLAKIPSRAAPRVEVTCATCHRGLPLPKSLQTTLFEMVKKDGPAAAVTRYRELRRDDMVSGRYNFGQWEINELARRLSESGDTAAAIAILEMNADYYPESAEIDYLLGELHHARGEREPALAAYQSALRKNPRHAGASARIAEIKK